MKLSEIVMSSEIEEKLRWKHRIRHDEVEQACLGASAHIRRAREGRYSVFGRTDSGRYVFVICFPEGNGVVRIISARDMTDSERDLYRRRSK